MSDDRLLLEDRQIIYRNLAGVQTKFNDEGARNFCILLEPDEATRLKEEGWNVKYSEARLEGAVPQAYLPVEVKYGRYAPMISVISNGKKSELPEENVNMLDWVDIEKVSAVLRPYTWEVNGKSGKKAYLKSMYVTLEYDPLAAKYAKEFEESNTSIPNQTPVISEIED